jgi:predicted ArsR family transcriptional regulator
VLQAPDIAKILAMSPTRVQMHLDALTSDEKRKSDLKQTHHVVGRRLI